VELTPDSDFFGDIADFVTDNRIVIAIVGAVSLIAGLAIPAEYRRA
jgi:predicted DNA-binding protein with PD1-like motif